MQLALSWKINLIEIQNCDCFDDLKDLKIYILTMNELHSKYTKTVNVKLC